jgi:hypothetical protein
MYCFSSTLEVALADRPQDVVSAAEGTPRRNAGVVGCLMQNLLGWFVVQAEIDKRERCRSCSYIFKIY